MPQNEPIIAHRWQLAKTHFGVAAARITNARVQFLWHGLRMPLRANELNETIYIYTSIYDALWKVSTWHGRLKWCGVVTSAGCGISILSHLAHILRACAKWYLFALFCGLNPPHLGVHIPHPKSKQVHKTRFCAFSVQISLTMFHCL